MSTELLDRESQQLIREAWCWAAECVKNHIIQEASEYSRPSAVMRPALTIDGDQWCALYGENLQDGVAGFGKSPYEAMHDFDKNWHAKLKPATP